MKNISTPIAFHVVAAIASLLPLALGGCALGTSASPEGSGAGVTSETGGGGALGSGGGASGGLTGPSSGGAPASGTGGVNSVAGSSAGGMSAGGTSAGGTSAGGTSAGGTSAGGNGGEVSGAAGVGGSDGNAGSGGSGGVSSICPTPNCNPIFNGQDLSGWTQVPATPPQWSVVDGALHSLATKRGYLYSAKSYGDFRFIFSLRQLQDPNPSHQPCVLYWGTSVTADAMLALQVQPPIGYLWDYRLGRSVAPPSTAHAGYKTPNTVWNRCEMLANAAEGTMRMACCPLPADGNGACTSKATEVVDFSAKNSKGPFVGTTAPLGLQIHTAGQIDEYKDLYVESPVAAPTTLLLVTP
jgi:hypothetical protein